MKATIGPQWSKKEIRAGRKMHQAWEAFFAAEDEKRDAEKEKKAARAAMPDSKVAQAVARHQSDLLNYPHVVGVSEGIRMRDGRPTGEPCVTVLVDRKVPESKLAKGDVLPRMIDGIAVDVVEVGEIVAL